MKLRCTDDHIGLPHRLVEWNFVRCLLLRHWLSDKLHLVSWLVNFGLWAYEICTYIYCRTHRHLRSNNKTKQTLGRYLCLGQVILDCVSRFVLSLGPVTFHVCYRMKRFLAVWPSYAACWCLFARFGDVVVPYVYRSLGKKNVSPSLIHGEGW